MEILDVFDENENKIAEEERQIVHDKGLWHRQVSCWIMNTKGELLLEKRNPNKPRNANKWARVGGHVEAGEEPIVGMQREIEEEIGVDIPEENLELLSTFKTDSKNFKKGVPHRYFGYNYFTVVDYDLNDYTMQEEEVSDLKYISIEEMEKIKEKNDSNYTFVNWYNFDEYIKLLKDKRNEIIK